MADRSSQRPGGDGRAEEPEANERLDLIAWDVLTDLLRQHPGLGELTPQGLRQLIGMRLEKEAEDAGVSASAMGTAFDRALLELIGANRPPSGSSEDAIDEGPPETVDDL